MQEQEETRTELQRKSMHLYCTQLAKALNDAGVSYADILHGKVKRRIEEEFKRIAKTSRLGNVHPHSEGYIKGINFVMDLLPSFNSPWNQHLVKYELWKPIQIAITGKESSKEPSPKQYLEIFEALNFKMAEWGVYVPWPTQESKQCQ